MNGVASKVLRYERHGFAACCQAVAPPRRRILIRFWGCAPVPLATGTSANLEMGVAQNQIEHRTAGQSRRLKSGGKAVASTTYDFEVKPH
jgi:hypothetical protein